MDEFMQALRDEDDQQEESRQTMNPNVAKNLGGPSKKLYKEDVFKRQLKAAKAIATGCSWVLNECARGIIESYSTNWLQKVVHLERRVFWKSLSLRRNVNGLKITTLSKKCSTKLFSPMPTLRSGNNFLRYAFRLRIGNGWKKRQRKMQQM